MDDSYFILLLFGFLVNKLAYEFVLNIFSFMAESSFEARFTRISRFWLFTHVNLNAGMISSPGQSGWGLCLGFVFVLWNNKTYITMHAFLPLFSNLTQSFITHMHTTCLNQLWRLLLWNVSHILERETLHNNIVFERGKGGMPFLVIPVQAK